MHSSIPMVFNISSHRRLTIWPIYIALSSLPPSIQMNKDNLIIVALWVGSKPPMHLLLKPLKQIMKRLSTTDICFRSPVGIKKVWLQPLFGVFDLIAKAPVLNMKQFNRLNGCPTCLHPGERVQVHVFTCQAPIPSEHMMN